MIVESENEIREIVADNGKLLKRKGTEGYFSRYIMFSDDTENDFEEVDERNIPQENLEDENN